MADVFDELADEGIEIEAVTEFKIQELVAPTAAALKDAFGDNISGAPDEAWEYMGQVAATTLIPLIMKQIFPEHDLVVIPINVPEGFNL